MLVLALQFSKGIAGRRDRAFARSTGPPWQRSREGSYRARGCGRPHEEEGRLPQNGREDKVSSSRRAKRNESYD